MHCVSVARCTRFSVFFYLQSLRTGYRYFEFSFVIHIHWYLFIICIVLKLRAKRMYVCMGGYKWPLLSGYTKLKFFDLRKYNSQILNHAWILCGSCYFRPNTNDNIDNR